MLNRVCATGKTYPLSDVGGIGTCKCLKCGQVDKLTGIKIYATNK